MFLLAWAIMFLSGALVSVEEYCQQGNYCITLIKEVTGEAGLCVVIPCSFNTDMKFTPIHIVWYKSKDDNKSCVFNSENNTNTEAGFKGRVSLLEPDVSQRNCSIVINDLTESDSGYYQLRVNGNLSGKPDGFSYNNKTKVSVSALKQKPSVMIPSLTEGQQATLTCTAPGLCSGSPPNITWMWRGKGENDSYITGNMTALNPENLTDVRLRHSSNLTFIPTAGHHNTKLSCKVSFTASITVQEETLNVTYARKPQISGRTSVKEGHDLNLTCSVDSFPPSEIKFSRKLNGNVPQEVNTSYYITNAIREDAGLYICTAKHLNSTLTEEINVTITWFSGILNTSGCVLKSELLTCVCISEGFPLPTINWSMPLDHTEDSVTVSGQAVRSTVKQTVKSHENISIKCFSSNENGETEKNLTIQNLPDESSTTVPWLEILIVALIGGFIFILLSIIAITYYRKKLKKSGNLVETLETISPDDPQSCGGQSVNNAQFEVQHGAMNGAGTLELNRISNDLTYAAIDLSKLNMRLEKEENPNKNETEYAEIQRQTKSC
ncbi:sialic acid-binding Ig-like lectin 5 [Xiphophorus maculatus]|uniref:Sialic acid-binding Ig-like lectin 5 n=1 Tax=Xiphophorus maculatus TaxID=8083 RepID=M3ZWL6_XIPMA|nr:sialic acid-binding Ig-like lectin 5 [Xiphophorus maculatus]